MSKDTELYKKDKLITKLNNIKKLLLAEQMHIKDTINALNNGKGNNIVNERLLDKLIAVEHEDEVIVDTVENISLILSNMTTNDIVDKKDRLTTYLDMLAHIESLLTSIEEIMELYISENNKESIMATETDNKNNTEHNDTSEKIIETIVPKSKLIRNLFYGAIIVIMISIAGAINNHFVNDVKELVTIGKEVMHMSDNSVTIPTGDSHE